VFCYFDDAVTPVQKAALFFAIVRGALSYLTFPGAFEANNCLFRRFVEARAACNGSDSRDAAKDFRFGSIVLKKSVLEAGLVCLAR